MHSVELQPGILSVKLDQAENTVLSNEAKDMAPRIPQLSEAAFLDELQQRASILKDRIGKVTDFMGKMSTHKGVKVAVFDFGKETVEGVGPTPLNYDIKEGENNLYTADVYRGLLVALVDWYGYGYTSQQDGLVHNNIIQVKANEETVGHSGSAKNELGLHVEDASFNLGQDRDISPDFLTLHFFRNDKKVPTTLAIPEWEKMSPGALDLLSQEWFYNQTNTMQGGNKNNPPKPVSVLYGPNADDPWIRINTALFDPNAYTSEQERALNEFTTHLKQTTKFVPASAGQVIVFDNRRVLHGRVPFSEADFPKYDGTDRWQRRLTVSCDMSRIQEFEESRRVVNPAKLFTKAIGV